MWPWAGHFSLFPHVEGGEKEGLLLCFVFKILFILSERERTQAGGGTGRGRSRLLADVGLDPRTLDHDLSRRQTLNLLSHPGAPQNKVIMRIKLFHF